MRSAALLALASLASLTRAIVIPDQNTLNALSLENTEPTEQDSHPFWNKIDCAEQFWETLEKQFTKAVDSVEDQLEHIADEVEDKFDDAVDYSYETVVQYGKGMQAAFAPKVWLGDADYDINMLVEEEPPHDGPPNHGPTHDGPPHRGPPHDRPPHDGPPHRGPPHDGPPHDGPPHRRPPHDGPPHDGPPHRGPPERRPHHPPHHGKPNETVYEIISRSQYTTKLAAAINEFPDLVDLLNGTKANYTIFAPTDRAFEKIPKHAPKPPKEFLKKLLTYHLSTEFYPIGRVFASRTIPTALDAEFLSSKDHTVSQRLSTQIGFRGLTVNFYSHVVSVDIFGTNGVIHGIDSILLPPPKAVKILAALPGEFSTLELALTKTGLIEKFSDTASHVGGTFFAPSNFAFQKLGPRINAFLFSPYGLKYLKALLLYHTAPNVTLYSDAIYKSSASNSDHHGPPKGIYHVDLPTALHHKSLSIDIARFGRLISIKINGFYKVVVSDGVAADGVIHVVPDVLIPPKTPRGHGVVEGEIDLDEFTDRLVPYVDDAEEDFLIPEL
ncbi:hypothetical protein DV736_g800, partial [Chaetothyriales sp. CBS 134916]